MLLKSRIGVSPGMAQRLIGLHDVPALLIRIRWSSMYVPPRA